MDFFILNEMATSESFLQFLPYRLAYKMIDLPTCLVVDLVEHELERLGGRELVLVVILPLRQKVLGQPPEKKRG